MTLKYDTSDMAIRGLIYGNPETGKTTTANTFPDPIFLQDAAARGARMISKNRININTIADLEAACNALAANPNLHKTVVFDDFPLTLRRWTQAQVAAKTSKDERAAFKVVYAKVQPALDKVLASSRHILFTGHAETELEDISVIGKTDQRKFIHPWLPDIFELWLTAMLDFVCYAAMAKSPDGKRTVWLATTETTSPSTRIYAKLRGGFNLPPKLQADKLWELLSAQTPTATQSQAALDIAADPSCEAAGIAAANALASDTDGGAA